MKKFPIETPYRLRQNHAVASEKSNDFYSHLEDFTQKYIRNALYQNQGIISSYQSWCIEQGFPKETLGEGLFDLLCLGMFLTNYGERAMHSPAPMIRLVEFLYRLRTSFSWLKPYLDPWRGRITSRYLLKTREAKRKGSGSMRWNLLKISRWLFATGEFREESVRVKRWAKFLSPKTTEEKQGLLDGAMAAYFDFREQAKEQLGDFTSGVGTYRKMYRGFYRGKEDELFCLKSEGEYHLNMLGSQIMNSALNPTFQGTQKRVVLLPGCMRPQEELCQARIDGLNISCTHCRKDCRISEIKKRGEEEGFELFVVPHSTRFTQWLDYWKTKKDVGVVASACVLNITTGGYEMKIRNIPSQCVLLDHCGCQKHWSPVATVTDIDESRLVKVATEGMSSPQ